MEPKLSVFSLEDYVSVIKPEFGRPDHFDLRIGFIIVFLSFDGGPSGGTLLHHSSCWTLNLEQPTKLVLTLAGVWNSRFLLFLFIGFKLFTMAHCVSRRIGADALFWFERVPYGGIIEVVDTISGIFRILAFPSKAVYQLQAFVLAKKGLSVELFMFLRLFWFFFFWVYIPENTQTTLS